MEKLTSSIAEPQSDHDILREYIQEIANSQRSSELSLEDLVSLEDWYYGTLDAVYLTEEDIEIEEMTAVISAESYLLSSDNNKYHINVILDDGFGDLKSKIKDSLKIMINEIVKNQIQNFISKARPTRNGLRYRRSKDLKFPHPLPYMNPSPSNPKDKIREEAGVVQAAVFFAFSKQAQTEPTKLTINKYETSRGILGKATVNYYHSSKPSQGDNALRITLNSNALIRNDINENEWAGVIAHEILHNLGWGHGKGDYSMSMPIEIYQSCIEGSSEEMASHLVR